jgi:cobalt-zinc-cadmium efflux system outer membrane protein
MPTFAAAQNNPPDVVNIKWDDLLEIVDENPALRSQTHKIEAAKSNVKSARAVPNPELEGAAGYGMAVDGSESRVEWGLSLSIPLDWLGKRGARTKAARAEVRATESEKEALRREVTLQLRLLFLDLLYNQERVAALEQLSAQTDSLAKVVQVRVDNGESRSVEAVQVRVEARKISGELVIAKSELKTSQNRLGTWINTGNQKTLVAVGDATTLPSSPPTSFSIEEYLAAHPDLKTIDAQLEAAAVSVQVEKRERIPEIAVAPFFDSELDRRAVGIGLSVGLPLWNFNTGNIEKAQSRFLAKKESRELRRREIQSELLAYRTACESGVEVATNYKNLILPDAQSAAETVKRTYELGEATLFEAINASRTLIETHLQFVAASLQAQKQCSRFTIATGGNFK